MSEQLATLRVKAAGCVETEGNSRTGSVPTPPQEAVEVPPFDAEEEVNLIPRMNVSPGARSAEK